MMKKLSSREKWIGVSTLMLATIYILVFMIIKPYQHRMAAINESLVMSQQRLETGRRVLQRREGLQHSIDQLTKEWGVAASDALEISALVKALETSALTSKIRIISIEPRQIKRDTLIQYPIALTISGNSRNIIHFISMIQAKPLGLNVENLNLERSMDGNAMVNGNLVVTRLRIEQK